MAHIRSPDYDLARRAAWYTTDMVKHEELVVLTSRQRPRDQIIQDRSAPPPGTKRVLYYPRLRDEIGIPGSGWLRPPQDGQDGEGSVLLVKVWATDAEHAALSLLRDTKVVKADRVMAEGRLRDSMFEKSEFRIKDEDRLDLFSGSYSDGFDRDEDLNTSADWTRMRSTWNGRLVCESVADGACYLNHSEGAGCYCTGTGAPTGTDMYSQVDCEYMADTVECGPCARVVGGDTSYNNMYAFVLYTGTGDSGTGQYFRFYSAYATKLTGESAESGWGQPVTLKLTVQGTSLEGFADGGSELTKTDSTHTGSGYAGIISIGTFSSGWDFDSFVADAIAAGQPTALRHSVVKHMNLWTPGRY
jgi:hypothetical protein